MFKSIIFSAIFHALWFIFMFGLGVYGIVSCKTLAAVFNFLATFCWGVLLTADILKIRDYIKSRKFDKKSEKQMQLDEESE